MHTLINSFYKHNGKCWVLGIRYKVGDIICEELPKNPLDEVYGHLIIGIRKERGNQVYAHLLNVRIKDNIFFCLHELNTENINIKNLGILYGCNCYQILESKEG